MISLSACRFRRTYRLLKTDDYSSVFNWRLARSNRYFQVYARPNEREHPRLGIVVGKKVAKRAHRRNYIKRIVREWFRQNSSELNNMDYIVRAKWDLGRENYPHAVIALAELFAKLGQCHTS